MQMLRFSLVDVISPYIAVTDTRTGPTQRPTTRPAVPRHRTFTPLRTEAREAEEQLREALAHRWTIDELASRVHLSTSHLSRVFVEAFGKSPLAYLTDPPVVRVGSGRPSLLAGADREPAQALCAGWTSTTQVTPKRSVSIPKPGLHGDAVSGSMT